MTRKFAVFLRILTGVSAISVFSALCHIFKKKALTWSASITCASILTFCLMFRLTDVMVQRLLMLTS